MEQVFCEKILKNFFLFFSSDDEALSGQILLAVSGGADSTALLLSAHELKSKLACQFSVVTVNHNIRSTDENLNDVRFVVSLCKKLSIPCYIEELTTSAVADYSKQNKCGIEAAARDLRYECFEKVGKHIGARFIATAHTEDDLYETILMRVFQGGSGKSLLGIPAQRGKYIRPLLNISRSEILSYLKSKNANYCNDSSNDSPKYLRNRIRMFLLPALKKTFPNWKSGIDKTISNVKLDYEFTETELLKALLKFKKSNNCEHSSPLDEAFVHKDDALLVSSDLFFSLDKALKLRILLRAFNLLGFKKRLPHQFLENAISIKLNQKLEGSRLGVSSNAEYLRIYKTTTSDNTITGYSLWVEKTGDFEYPLGVIRVFSASNTDDNLVFISDYTGTSHGFGPFSLPFHIRSPRIGDRIEIAQKKFKTVKKLINEFNLNSRNRGLLPIIEGKGIILGIYGFPVGGKNRVKFSGS